MHFWSDVEKKYLLDLLNHNPRPSFSEITTLFRERFPQHSWTSSMISGQTSRLGMCKPDPFNRRAKDCNGRTLAIKREKVKLTTPSFMPTKPQFTMVDMNEVDTQIDAVTGCTCKWPMATGGECGAPADSRGYCSKHSTIVRRGVQRTNIIGI